MEKLTISSNSNEPLSPVAAAAPAVPLEYAHEELKRVVSENKLSENKPTHFVFAYGSLICDKSRAITAPTVARKQAVPVEVQHVERVWAKRSRTGMTAMGVRFKRDTTCTGVLLEVTEEELSKFDEREIGYHRYEIPLDHVEQVSFLCEKTHYNEDHIVFEAKEDGVDHVSEHMVFVWIYVQRYDLEPNEDHPIAQSYVDIILRGCLNISKDFARSFIDTTSGWALEDDENGDDGSDGDNVDVVAKGDTKSENTQSETVDKEEETEANGEEEAVAWVDDREDPLYTRADPAYSLKRAEVIDQLLQEHLPEEVLELRKPINEDEEGGGEQLTSPPGGTD